MPVSSSAPDLSLAEIAERIGAHLEDGVNGNLIAVDQVAGYCFRGHLLLLRWGTRNATGAAIVPGEHDFGGNVGG